jgi:hypothetical protein
MHPVRLGCENLEYPDIPAYSCLAGLAPLRPKLRTYFFVNPQRREIDKMNVRLVRFHFSAAVVAVMVILLSGSVKQADAQGLTVEQTVICKNVVNRVPVDAGNSFATSVGKIFCFTKIVGARHPTEITHVWYFDGTERDRVTLSVGASPWRTYSSKRLRPNDVGPWHVDVLDAGGNMLDRVAFNVVP